MAQHKSARKRARSTVRRTRVNDARKGRVRSFLREVESAIASGDSKKARAALVAAQPEVQRGAQKGVLAKATAARKLSRLSKRIKKLSK